MTKEWVDKKNRELQQKVDIAKEHLTKALEDLNCDDKVFKESFKEFKNGFFMEMSIKVMFIRALGMSLLDRDGSVEVYFKEHGLYDDIKVLSDVSYWTNNINQPITIYDMYLDSDWVDFCGTIIITDPCYLESEDKTINDLYTLDECGFKPFLSRYTIYGDWGCHTFHKGDDKVLGEFCADAGMVCVVLKEDLDRFNPNCELKDFMATSIPNFKGRIRFVVNEEPYSYDYDGETHSGVEYVVSVVGEGVNFITGENLDFWTGQTGL